jgi:sodium-coupled neutral amino acid transporter 9
MMFSNLLMFAVVIIYYELMSQALYPVIAAVLEWVFNTEDNLDTGLAFDRFSLFYTCIALSVILYPVVSKKDISLFVTVNSFGVIFVCITITFIFSYGFYSFTNTNFIISNDDNDVKSDIDDRSVSLFRSQFSSLAGMMTLGYFLHNISLSIVKENRHPEHNQRDVFIGYFLVFLSYSFVGTLGYLGFSGTTFDENIRNTQNLLYMFKSTDILAFLVRIA